MKVIRSYSLRRGIFSCDSTYPEEPDMFVYIRFHVNTDHPFDVHAHPAMPVALVIQEVDYFFQTLKQMYQL